MKTSKEEIHINVTVTGGEPARGRGPDRRVTGGVGI